MKAFQKIVSRKDPELGEVAKLHNEYFLTQHFELEGIIQTKAMRQEEERYILEFEEFDGSTLEDILSARRIPFLEGLQIAERLTEIVEHLHAIGIVHLNISPSTIWLNPASGEVRLSGFGLAFKGEQKFSSGDLIPDGGWHYISPEQTGRINRPVDFRTDLYALGLVFFELFGGRKPFMEDEPLKMVHAHLTRKPSSLQEPEHGQASGVPVMLSRIVDRLLEKNAEDRYQSAYGLLQDIRTCKTNLKENQEIKPFDLGTFDLTGRLQISQKVYGRESETAALKQVFAESVAGKSRTVLISGISGVGKTTLVGELKKEISLEEGVFFDCKFQQLKRGIPYFAILEALDKWIDLVLASDEEELQEWKKAVQEIVGVYGKLFVDRLPRIQLLLDKWPDVKLDYLDTQNLFNNLLLNIFELIIDRIQPLVLYLDDLQWADMASLKFLLSMVRRFHDSHLLLIGAYRSNELTADHPFLVRIRELEESGLSIRRFELEELDQEDVANFLSDTFVQYEEATLEKLVTLFYKKTGGNAFYLKQFLRSLYQKDFFQFDLENRAWNWDIKKIQQVSATENVVELVKEKLASLPPQHLEILCLASCLGNHFTLGGIARISDLPLREIAPILYQAEEENIIVPVGATNPMSLLWEAEDQLTQLRFRFIHDGVYFATYSSLDDARKMDLHWQIGHALTESLSAEEQEDALFDICNHLNKALPLLPDETYARKLAQRNLQASQRAKQASAFESARGYIDVARKLFGEYGNETWQDLEWEIFRESTELAYYTLDHDALDAISREAIQRAPSPVDQAVIYEIRIIAHVQNSQLEKALEEGFEVLKKLNIKLSSNPDRKIIIRDLIHTRLLLRGRTPGELAELPPLHDNDRIILALRIMKHIGQAGFFTSPNILAVTVLKMIRLILRYGMSDLAAVGFVGYSIILNGVLNNQQLGTQYGKLALDLSAGSAEWTQRLFIKYVYYGFIHFWVAPLKDCLEPLRDTYEVLLEKGDWENCSFSGLIYLSHLFHNGERLPRILEISQDYEPYILPIQKAKSLYQIAMQGIYNLSTLQEDNILFRGPYFNEQEDYAGLEDRKDGNSLGFFAIYKSLLYLLLGEEDKVFSDPRVGMKVMELRKSSIHFPWYLMIRSHALFRRWQAGKVSRREYKHKTRKYLARLAKYAKQSPENFENLFLLVQADLQYADGNLLEAQKSYQLAANSARTFSHPLFEGLASEANARLYQSLGNHALAANYFQEAMEAYRLWGAEPMVQKMEYAFQQVASAEFAGQLDANPDRGQGRSSFQQLDESTVWQATSAISKEVQLTELIRTIMNLVLENAGADSGLFLMRSGDHWRIRAQVSLPASRADYDIDESLDGSEGLSRAIVNYVIRTGETIILNDPTQSSLFAGDAYLVQQDPKSVLCTPIVYKEQIQAILYLENSLVKGAFTEHRKELLQLLLTQIAISIENAKLYENLDEAYRNQVNLTQAYRKFVPQEFIESLGFDSILDVRLGDQIKKNMTIFFSDIRAYTTMSERMSPAQNFEFINQYLERIVPLIKEHNGFVSQYLGDGIMAIFMGSTEDAVRAAIEIQKTLQHFEWQDESGDIKKVITGIGVHFGPLMMGIIGTDNRLDTGFVSDAVNTASRMEGLTKTLGGSILISKDALDNLSDPDRYNYRFLGEVKVKGKRERIGVFEFFDGDPPSRMITKKKTQASFHEGLNYYLKKDYQAASDCFERVVELDPEDKAAIMYLNSCRENSDLAT